MSTCSRRFHSPLPRGPGSDKDPGLFCSSGYGVAAEPSTAQPRAAHRRCIDSERKLFNKLPRGSAGTGRPLSSQLCGRSAAGSARRCQRRGRGFDPRRPLHFGCARASPSLAQPRERRGGMCMRSLLMCSECTQPACRLLARGHSRSGFRPRSSVGSSTRLVSERSRVRIVAGGTVHVVFV
jgi:hypothetical protein